MQKTYKVNVHNAPFRNVCEKVEESWKEWCNELQARLNDDNEKVRSGAIVHFMNRHKEVYGVSYLNAKGAPCLETFMRADIKFVEEVTTAP